MAAFTFDAVYFSLVVFLSAIIPGLAIGLPLLKKTDFGAMEKALLCFFIGLFAVPALLFLEALVGIEFSLFLVIANMAIITITGILFMKMRLDSFGIPHLPEIPKIDSSFFTRERAIALAVPALLLLALIFAFWIRIQTYSPMYSELDPYWYVYGTGQIIQDGMVPAKDDTSWWPEVTWSHRNTPLKMYLEAEWYSLYTNGGEYNNYLLFTTSSWLPPISAAFVSFGAYLLVSSLYGRRYGLVAAFLLAFLPITIYKMSAGVNEAAPVGNMVLFMAAGLFALSLIKKNKSMHILSGIAFLIAVTASNFTVVISLPLAGMAVLQSLDYFIRGKQNRDFLEALLAAFGGFFLGTILNAIYLGSSISSVILYTPVLLAICGAAFAALTHYLFGLGLNEKKRYTLLGAAIIAGLLLVFLSPLSGFVKNAVFSYVGAADFQSALDRTIAEQNLAGTSFEGEAGFLALVPTNHADIYGALAPISSAFTFIGNAFFRFLDILFSTFAGLKQTTSVKEDSLFFVFLVISLAGLAMRHFSRKDDERDIPSIALLVLIVTMPVLYIGMNKIKYTIFSGMMIAVAAAVAFAELERLCRWLMNKFTGKAKVENDEHHGRPRFSRYPGAVVQQQASEQPSNNITGEKYLSYIFAGILILAVYAQAAGPVPYAYIFTIKSFEPRYQDNPAALTPVASKLCADLRAKGVPINQMQSLCDAGSNLNFSDSINSQFDSNVCWLSQMKVDELFPAANDTGAQQRSSEAVSSAKFRCNRLSDYWIDSMEWMGKNLNASDRVNSWWDYGHWTNYFADKKTVLRNEHASYGMIGRVAHDYIVGSTQDMIDSMNYFDSQYVLFDIELVGGSPFGGKYGALNYLGCVHEGATTLHDPPGTSQCEYDHSPERIAVPAQTAESSCVISESQQRMGVYAFRLGKEGIDQTPAYCIGETTTATGEKLSVTYYLDRKDADGNLVISKGFIRQIDNQAGVIYAEMVYNNQKVWYGANGTLVDGMEDAKTAFYTSNLYRAFYLNDLPGFDLVYSSKGGEVKIYRMKNFTGNKAGWVDPATVNLTQ